MVVKLLATTNEAHVGNMKVVGDLDSKCRDRAESKNRIHPDTVDGVRNRRKVNNHGLNDRTFTDP